MLLMACRRNRQTPVEPIIRKIDERVVEKASRFGRGREKKK